MGRVVTFGELMLKLSPPAYERLIQAHSFNVDYSGAEANVAVSLSSFGVPTSVVSAVPNSVIPCCSQRQPLRHIFCRERS